MHRLIYCWHKKRAQKMSRELFRGHRPLRNLMHISLVLEKQMSSFLTVLYSFLLALPDIKSFVSFFFFFFAYVDILTYGSEASFVSGLEKPVAFFEREI